MSATNTTAWEVTVGDALAAKLLAIDGILDAIALGDDDLKKYPGVLVTTPATKLDARTGSLERWTATYPCVLVHDIRKSARATLASMGTLVARIRLAWWDGIALGLAPLVVESMVDNFTPEIFEITGQNLPAYRFDAIVKISMTGLRT